MIEAVSIDGSTMSIAEPRDLIEVLSRMEYWRQEPPVDRKRAFRRFVVRGEATLEPMQTGQSMNGHVHAMLRDISRGGIGFLADSFLQPGEVWRIRFEQHGHLIGQQPILVKFCRLVQDGMYLTGGQFVIEPALLIGLGVDEGDLHNDTHIANQTLDTAEFLPPPSHSDTDAGDSACSPA